MNMGKLRNLSLLKTTVGPWAMITKGTECLTDIQLIGEHASEQKNYFSFYFLDLPIQNYKGVSKSFWTGQLE
jgi:hypothetical protein